MLSDSERLDRIVGRYRYELRDPALKPQVVEEMTLLLNEFDRLRIENSNLWDNVAHLASHHANEHRECNHTVNGREHG